METWGLESVENAQDVERQKQSRHSWAVLDLSGKRTGREFLDKSG